MPLESAMILAGASVSAVAVISLASLRGWQDWLALKTRELDRLPREIEGGVGQGMARIEMADLKERIRKLEAIAAGVDL
ncbi:MAG: hypothetical protein KGL44_01750 [Sphingomonadales bacterium]|nr:hypothetical protein [Sphingomonadales bacterium]